MPAEGNKLGCAKGNPEDVADEAQRRPVSPPKERKTPKNQQKLVRVGSKLYGKNTHVKRKFNIGLRVEKAPGGVAFHTQNEIVVLGKRRNCASCNAGSQGTRGVGETFFQLLGLKKSDFYLTSVMGDFSDPMKFLLG